MGSIMQRLAGAVAALGLVVTAAGCATTVAGAPVTGPHGACTADRIGPERPDSAAAALVTVSSTSGWQPGWTVRRTLALYPDGSVARVPDGPGADAALQPVTGGWVDGCTFDRLTGEFDALIGADYGEPQIFDASTTVLTIAAGDGRKAATVSVYALGVGDDASGLTGAQRDARKAVAGWIDDLRKAVTETGPLPDRVRVTPTGKDPSAGTIVAPSPPEQSPVPWQGSAVPTDCTVLTGNDAAAALASVREAMDSRTSQSSRDGAPWGVFSGPDGSRAYLGVQQVLPGDGCR